jgi:hypothetical protein
MKNIHFTKMVVLGFACAFGITPAAAQSTGSMVPLPGGGTVQRADTAVAAKPAGKLSRALEFNTVAAAAAHCANGEVVWSTLSKGHSFHVSSSRYYGKTKHGAYVCKADALAAGFHQAKS